MTILYDYTGWDDIGVISDAANIRFGTNPEFTIDDFISVYPLFGAYSSDDPPVWSGVIPESVLQMYINLASACVAYERWQESWEMAMGLFVAHYATLYLRSSAPSGSTAKAVAAAGIAKGIQVSKSVGDVSVSYQAIVANNGTWAQWGLTAFGQQFMSIAKLIGMGGMVVW